MQLEELLESWEQLRGTSGFASPGMFWFRNGFLAFVSRGVLLNRNNQCPQSVVPQKGKRNHGKGFSLRKSKQKEVLLHGFGIFLFLFYYYYYFSLYSIIQ